MTADEPVEGPRLSDNCLDCALGECDICEASYTDGFGCCCGRNHPINDEDYDDD